MVEDVFEQFGEIHSVRMAKGKNFCHVRYTGEGSVDQALAMSGGGLQCVSASVRRCTSASVLQQIRASVHQCVSAPVHLPWPGWRMRVGGLTDDRNTGRLHVDFAQVRAGAVDLQPALTSPRPGTTSTSGSAGNSPSPALAQP